jgi:luciferase family oxidoreductase group 1
MRVGSGGVMLTHYSPLKVAEQFRMLEALYPGRIDLGLGRAPGSDTRTAQALAHGPGALGIDHYPDQLMDLYGFLSDDFPANHPFRGIKAMPEIDTMPELWLLGSSSASAMHAAEMGWAFAYAQFINPEGGDHIVQRYRDLFKPSPFLSHPRVAIGLSATCADTDEEAEHLSWSRWNWRIAGRSGGGPGIPSPEEAKAFKYTEPELDYIAHMRTRSIHGSPGHVKDRILETCESFGAEEAIIVTITYDFEARKRSYTLIAHEFGLEPHPGSTAHQ